MLIYSLNRIKVTIYHTFSNTQTALQNIKVWKLQGILKAKNITYETATVAAPTNI